MQMTHTQELVRKIHFTLTSRRLVRDDVIQEHLLFPESREQEQQIVKDALFAYLKKAFPGCKIRPNRNSFSLRLDGQLHRNANKLISVLSTESEWARWFERNHSSVYRTFRNTRSAFASSTFQKREADGHTFLYIPFLLRTLPDYNSTGLQSLLNAIDSSNRLMQTAAEAYEQFNTLMEREILRREEQRRERVQRELQRYQSQITNNLYGTLSRLVTSEEPLERLLYRKYLQHNSETGQNLQLFPITPTYKEMVPVELKVEVFSPEGSENEGWLVLPPFEGGVRPAENYTSQGFGPVTGYSTTDERSNNGASPVVVLNYIYAAFDMEHWKHLLPENFERDMQVHNDLLRDAQSDLESFLEQERLQAEEQARIELEEQEAREREDAEREAVRRREIEELELQSRFSQEEQDARRRTLRDSLLHQLTPAGSETEPDVDADRAEEAPVAATQDGLYYDNRTIPLLQYVLIRDGQTRRFRTQSALFEEAGEQESYSIHDFYAPHGLLEVVTPDSDDAEDTEMSF